MNNTDGPSSEMPSIDYRRGFRRQYRPVMGPRGMRTPYWVDVKTPEVERVEIPKTRVFVTFGYDLLGDIKMDDWLKRFVKAQDEDWVDEYDLMTVQVGSFGLRHLNMHAQMEVPAGTKEQVESDVFMLLSSIIGETNVQIYFISQA